MSTAQGSSNAVPSPTPLPNGHGTPLPNGHGYGKRIGMHTLGVLGGMGPAASCLFLHWIIERARVAHGARRNEDFPHILLSSLPVMDLVRPADLSGQESV